MRFPNVASRSTLAAGVLSLALGGCAGMLTGGPLVRDPNGPTGQIVVANRSSTAVRSVLISSCSASTYGLNRMSQGETIAAGATRTFTVTPGCWDVMAGNSNSAPRRRVNVTTSQPGVYVVS